MIEGMRETIAALTPNRISGRHGMPTMQPMSNGQNPVEFTISTGFFGKKSCFFQCKIPYWAIKEKKSQKTGRFVAFKPCNVKCEACSANPKM